MGQTLISAADVQAAKASGRLAVPRGAIITPLARDVARDLGVDFVVDAAGAEPGAATRDGTDADLVSRVRTIVASLLGADGGGDQRVPAATRRPVIHADMRSASLQPFPYPGPPPEMSVRTGDVVTAADGSPVAVGYMAITKGSFPWTLTYDEAQIVLEGELHLGGDAGGKIGRPGDVLFVPEGSTITFGTPNWAKFVYVTFPANWEEMIRPT